MDAALRQYNKERLPDVQALLAVNQMWSNKLGMRQEVCPPVLPEASFQTVLSPEVSACSAMARVCAGWHSPRRKAVN